MTGYTKADTAHSGHLWWRRAAVFTVAGTGLIHLALAPAHLYVSYVGALFLAGGLVCVFVGVRLWQGCSRAHVWILGATVTGGMAVGLITSRAIGLPGAFGLPAMREDEWGVLENASLLFELGFLAVAVLLFGERRARRLAMGIHRERSSPAADQAALAPLPPGALSRRRVLAALTPMAGTAAAATLLGGPTLGLAAPRARADEMPGMGGGAQQASATPGMGFVGSVDLRSSHHRARAPRTTRH